MSEVNVVKSIYKALDILESISNGRKDAGVQELSVKLGLPSSTTHRILSTLETRGYVKQNSENKYSLGLKLLDLQLSLSKDLDLPNLAHPVMQEIVEQTRESTNLAVRENLESIHILRLESPEVLRANVQGYRLPIHSSATGKVLLAFAPEAVLNSLPEQFPAFTEKTITSKEKLIQHLESIRNQGYGVDDEEGFEKVRSIALPIYNHEEQVIAALSIVGPSDRFTFDRIPMSYNLLKSATAEISRKLGYRG